MRLLSVIPVAKGTRIETLSYYTTGDVRAGALVRIPLRKKLIPGLVISSRSLGDEKAAIRQAAYALKKIDGVITSNFFPASFMSAAGTIAHLSATHIGPVLAALTPNALFEELPARFTPHEKKARVRDILQTTRILQIETEHRHAHYKSMVRESFARKESICVVTPSAHDAERLFSTLSRGIEEHSCLFVTTLPPKKLRALWKKALEEKHPLLCVITPSFLSLPRSDIGLYIVERESSSLYKMRERPHLDMRLAVTHIAKTLSADVVFGDSFLSLETLARYQEHEIEDVIRPSMKQQYTNSFEVLDVRHNPDETKKPELFSERAKDALLDALRRNARLFVYVTRRGFASLTICRDCGSTLSCDRCDAPMVLHATETNGEIERVFVCHRCNRRRGTQTVCDTCGGWRLEAFGYGIQRAKESLAELFPEAKIFEISSDTTRTPRRITDTVERWRHADGGVLLGTEMALPHVMAHGVDTTVMVSIDSLIALPDFRMNERLFHLLSDIRSASRTRCCVQTRNPTYAALSFVEDGDGSALYRYEEKMRKEHGYPPWSVPIKISLRGEREQVTKSLEELAKTLAPRETAVYPAFISTIKRVFEAHLLVTLKKDEWPDDTLLELLKNLPPQYDVDVNPLSFL